MLYFAVLAPRFAASLTDSPAPAGGQVQFVAVTGLKWVMLPLGLEAAAHADPVTLHTETAGKKQSPSFFYPSPASAPPEEHTELPRALLTPLHPAHHAQSITLVPQTIPGRVKGVLLLTFRGLFVRIHFKHT